MGKILDIAIQNYGLLKNIKMGQLLSDRKDYPLGNMVAISSMTAHEISNKYVADDAGKGMYNASE